ncbi:hypothetical protein MNBD_GAMMA16-1962 [hydrothermal vent metagenome]|uniref:Uncharacterized protein n=1 Tax=hydrothermal vent metagenome TaxID=652676 RepID=A0A3B0Z424_9ZZZZ
MTYRVNNLAFTPSNGFILLSTLVFLVLISSISMATMEQTILDTKITIQRTQSSTLEQNTTLLTHKAITLINSPGFKKNDTYNNGRLDPYNPAHWFIRAHNVISLNGKYIIEYFGCFVPDQPVIKRCDINVTATRRIYQYRINAMSELSSAHQRRIQAVYTTTQRPNWEPQSYDNMLNPAPPQSTIMSWIDL